VLEDRPAERLAGGTTRVEGGEVDPTTARVTVAQWVRDARRNGSPAAFSALVGHYERTALAVAYACCGDSHAAGDIVQDAFLRAWRRLGELKDEGKFAAWLCGIVRNAASDARRRSKPALGGDALTTAGATLADPRSQIEGLERAEQIGWALRQLDEASRAAVVLRYYEGLSSAQIAELTDSSPAAVDMRLSRARRRLRELLDEPDPCAAAGSTDRTSS
jgi:RNA polymerase sigma-70 factor (ECF subfamily)